MNIKIEMKNLLLFGLTAVFVFSSSFAFAQEDEPKARVRSSVEKRNDRLRATFLNQLKEKRGIAEVRIANRLADINRAVELTEIQNRKLMIASKGAVRNYMVKADNEMIDRAKKLGFDLDTTQEPGQQVRSVIGSSRIKFQTVSREVESEEIWNSSIEKVLTDEQNEVLGTWLEERAAYRKNIALDLFVARVDSLLLLSPEQREKLRVVFDTRYGEQLASRLEKQFASYGIVSRNGAQDDLDTSALEDILSEDQLAQWKQAFGAEIRRMEAEIAKQKENED